MYSNIYVYVYIYDNSHIDGNDYTVVVSEVTACDGNRPQIVLEFPEMLGGNSNYEGCTSVSLHTYI